MPYLLTIHMKLLCHTYHTYVLILAYLLYIWSYYAILNIRYLVSIMLDCSLLYHTADRICSPSGASARLWSKALMYAYHTSIPYHMELLCHT